MDDPKFWITVVGPVVLAIVIIYLVNRFRERRVIREILDRYSLQESVLTKAELNFYRVLKEVVGEKYAVLVKVRLADLFSTRGGEGYYSAFNKISAKHIDFLLADPQSFSPVLAIELDDRSHQNQNRKNRDEFVDQIFEKTGLKLLRVKAANKYDPVDIRDRIADGLKQRMA